MRALPTYYSNHMFRSRTESRYAVMFDVLGVEWQFEAEGFDLDEGDYYIPDFWLPQYECYVEIKGQFPTELEIRKCRKLQWFTENDVVLMWGLPAANAGFGFITAADPITHIAMPSEIDIVFDMDEGRMVLKEGDEVTSRTILAAAARAKSARFTYGGAELVSVVDYERIAF